MADTTLLPVIIGGLLTMGGGVITGGITLVVNAIQRSSEMKKRRADKFEELVGSVYEFDGWVDNCRRRDAVGLEVPDTISPFAKVQSIASVYFPQFDGAIRELDCATGQYRVWMTAVGLKRIEGDVAAAKEGFHDAYTPYAEKRNNLVEALKKFAHEEFQ